MVSSFERDTELGGRSKFRRGDEEKGTSIDDEG